MNTDTLKISLAKKILNISDTAILEKINSLLNKEIIIGYDPTTGKPITEEQYIAEMDKSIRAIQNGTAKTLTTEQVRKNIVDANNLG